MRVCPVWFWDLAGWFVKALPIFGSGLISSCQRDELERDVARLRVTIRALGCVILGPSAHGE